MTQIIILGHWKAGAAEYSSRKIWKDEGTKCRSLLGSTRRRFARGKNNKDCKKKLEAFL